MRSRTAALLLPLLVAALACDVNPSAIDGAPLLFEGTIAFEGSESHEFVVTNAGGVRIRIESLLAEPPLAEGFTPSLGLGFGEPNETGDCLASFSSGVTEGSSFAFGLTERTYCVHLFDNGTLDEEDTRTYAVRVTRSE